MRKSFKLLLGLLLAVLMVASVMTVGVFAEDDGAALLPLEGSGTEADPYRINDLDDLVNFSKLVNAGSTFAGEYVELTADIDLTGVVWTPIGTSNYDKAPDTEGVKMFAGNFDGGNHTITGLSSDGYVPAASETGSTEYSFGLFGYVYGANISNVKLANVDINGGTRTDSEGNEVYGSGVAALIGYYFPADETATVIENCHVLNGTVKASNNMGGLIGHLDSQTSQPKVDITIENCSNAADVTTEAREAGGILGLMNSAREGNYYVTMSGTVTFKDCVNTGAITSLGGGAPSAGGILGRDHNQASGQRLKIVFDGCENSGTITVTANGETHAAGIGAGYYSAGAWLIAKNCTNTGDVVVSWGNSVYAGGLISYGGVVELIDSTSTGSVTVGGSAGNTYVGGAQSILFLDGIENFSDTVNGYIYWLNGGTSPEYAALVDDAAYGGNFHLVETAYKDYCEFLGWYDNPEFTGNAYTALSGNVKTYYAKWKVIAAATVGGVNYETLQAAIDAATAGQTVTLLTDVTLTETLEILAGKTVTLDLNGKTISQEKACTAHYEMILNKGTLTITGEGKISFKDTGAGDPNFGWGSYTINNRGTLVVENGTIEHLGEQAFATHMICAIQQSAGSTTINGGVISTPAYRSVRVNGGDLVINGGEFDGQVWLQPNQGGVTITVTGGTFGPNGGDGSSIFMTNKGERYTVTVATISGGVFTTKIGASDPAALSGAITGGSFSEAAKNGTNAALISKDVKFGDVVNGYFDVVKKDYVAEIVGGEKYESLEEAIAAAENGDTITLLADIDLSKTLKVTGSITLDLNGKTITGTDNATGSFALIEIQPSAELTVKDETGEGKITLVATNDRDWNAYSSVISNQRGKLTVEGGTIEHLGGTDMAYAIDNLTNGKGTYAETVINGGTVKSTYRAIRQFLNGVEAQNILTINGGTIEGANKSVWMQDPNKNANSGSLTIGANASLKGDVYLFVIAGSTEWPVEVSINASALKDGSVVMTGNVPATYVVENVNGTWGVNKGLKGSGTETDPYQIGTLSELILFRDSVNAGETKYNAKGVYVALTADIDMKDVDWSVNIGDDCNATFDGIFDGKNFTIMNLTSTETAAKADGYICTGLFGAIYGDAVIKNLTIENVNINTGDFVGNNASAVVGFAYSVTGSIENVHVIGDIQINAKDVTGVGAIVGYAYGGTLQISDCTVVGNAGSTITGAAYVGGIIGYASAKNVISDCSVENVTINATNCAAGGIAGILLAGGKIDGATVRNVELISAHQNWKNAAGIAVGTITGTVTVSDVTYENVTGTTAMVGAVHQNKPTTPVAKVQACIGDTYYKTLADALAAAKDGDTVTLLAPIVVKAGETLILNKAITITYTSNVPGEDMITNKGNLIIDGTTLVYVNTDTTASNVTVSTISCEPGSTLTVTGGVVKNDSANNGAKGIYAYAIDLLTNGSLGDVTATINGGEIICTNYMAIRQFNNGEACKNTLNVNGGYIYGARRAIQIHLKNNAAYTTITDGTIEAGDYSLCFLTTSENITVSGGKFIGSVWYSGTDGFISGGNFSEPVEAVYCAEGYVPTENADGTYGVLEITRVTVTLDDATVVMGNKLPDFTYQLSDPALADKITVTFDAINYNAAGTYTITATVVAPENYEVTVVNGTLTVSECVVTVDGIAYDNWNDAKAAIKRNSVIKLYADIEYGIDENGKKVEHKFPANGGNIVLDLNGHNLTYHYAATIQFKTVLTVTDTSNGTPGKLIADYPANPFVISPESSLELTNGVIFEGTLQLNGSTSKACYLSINGQKVIGNALSNSPVQFINGYVRIKITDNFSSIQVTNGTLQVAENCKTPANQTVILNAGTSLIVPEGVTLNLDATTDLVINGTLNVEGTLVVNSFEHFKQFLNMESVKNLAVGSTIIIDEDYVLDLAGRTILVDGLNKAPAFRVLANVTVKNGTVDATAGISSYAFIVGNSTTAGKLTVENGNYSGSVSAISVTKGDLIINGGYFEATEYNGAHEFTINCIDENYRNGTATVTITGGTFYGFNPQNNAAEGLNTNFLAPGYAVKFDGNAYTVVYGNAAIGNVGYATLQDALDAAKDGDVVTLQNDITVGKNDANILDGSYYTFFKVEGKSVTVDLNGHNIFADAAGMDKLLVGVFSTENGGHLTLNDTVGGAVVEAVANGATVYSLIANYEPGCSITINGGTYKLDKASDSLIYSGASVGENEGIVVNGGTFVLDNVDTGVNGKPWIFNVLGSNNRHVDVHGGTFNFNIAYQNWAHEVNIVDDNGNLSYVIDNGDGTWTVSGKTAEVGIVSNTYSTKGFLVGYATFKDAVASIKKGQAETTIKLQKNITVKGQFIGHSYAQKVVIDLNGYTMSSADKTLTVYRSGTTVLIKNGTVSGNTSGGTIQVTYGGQLTLENVTVKSAGGSGNAIKVDANSTLIIADENVKVLGGARVNDILAANGAIIKISAGFFAHPVKDEWCAEGYFPITVEGGYSVATGACMIGNTVYGSLADAIEAAKDGDIIVMKNDITVSYADALDAADGFKSLFVISGKTITIDLNGKKILGDATGAPELVGGKYPEGMLLGMFTTLANGHLTLVDSSEGEGTVELASNGCLVYGLIVNYDKDCSITINEGNYIADDVFDALVYTSCDEGVVVNDGYFYLANVGQGTRGNGSPWIFNALGQNINSVVVNGGTFNANVNAQHWVFEVKVDKTLALKDNGDGTWTVVEAVAYVNNQHWASGWYTRETGYATFQEALAACEGVKTMTIGKKDYTSEKEIVTLLGDIDLDGPIIIG